MKEFPAWIRPGVTTTLLWYDGMGETSDDYRLYQVAGPVLEQPPASPYFLLAPLGQSDFAGRLYRSEVSPEDLRGFLRACEVAEGRLTEDLDFVAARRRAPVLPVLDAWAQTASGETLPYDRGIDAFLLPDANPLFVTAEAFACVLRERDRFGATWVCEECGEADDAAVFLWTTHRDDVVQVRLAIENQGGVWTCRLHPFTFRKEEGTHA